MKPFLALLGREARDARLSLAIVPLAAALALSIVHALLPAPFAVADAAATTVAILTASWTLYFAADSFATDLSSGRLASVATLPVRALELWSVKLAFVVVAIAWAAGTSLACEYALQAGWGSAQSLEQFHECLARLASAAPLLAVLAGAAMLCSLLVEGALAAVLLTLIVVTCLVGGAWACVRVVELAGIDRLWIHSLSSLLFVAAVLFAAAAVAFVRGQRRLGSRAVRAKVALTLVASIVVLGGGAGAAALHKRFSVELDNPRMRFLGATASSDGRWLAFEGFQDLSGNDDPPPAAWCIDLDSGARSCLARPGYRVADRYVHSSLAWDAQHPLHVLSCDAFGAPDLVEVLAIRPDGEKLRIESLGTDRPLESRILPTWAELEMSRASDGSLSTITVHWKERALEQRFTRADCKLFPGVGLLPGRAPGTVFTVSDGRVVMLDLASGASDVLVDDRALSMDPSPDGSAVIVRGEHATRALSTLDGSLLHEPWARSSNVRWIDSNDGAHVVEVTSVGVVLRATTVLDLDSGYAFEIERSHEHALLHRVAPRGYVFVDASGDIVLVDLDGKLVRVLIDR